MKPQTEVTSLATDPENLQISDIVLSGDAAFWDANDSLQAAIGSWDPAHGTRQLVRFLGDHTKGAGGLGTDGKDMVWSYGEGKQPGDDISTYPTRSIMTAPFTTDPAALKPRRLRSQPGETIGVTTWVLGCGYAAHVSGLGAIVVRIADGVSWVLPSNYPDFTPKTPIGLTCDDVFVMGTLNGKIDIGRFRLDSLGPGTPPD